MSRHVTLTLHDPEETVTIDLSSALVPYPGGTGANPIGDYFSTTDGLVKKIVDTKYSNDAEILGLLVLGVISSAEFYYRSIFSEIARTCPLCISHAETVNVPLGAIAFYSQSGFPPAIATLEHKSLADSKRIAEEILRFTGFQIKNGTSEEKALDDFERLCELRHCIVHARGFVGMKAISALDGKRTLHKLLVKQEQALDFIKLSHNAVRAVNHFLGNSVINRWIDKDVLAGEWKQDKKLFVSYWNLFRKRNEDAYSGSPLHAYKCIRPIIGRRRKAISKPDARKQIDKSPIE